jgi:hypothetical protein
MIDIAWLGPVAIVAMPLGYALGSRSPRLMLGFAAGCTMASAVGFTESAWPFGLAEMIWIAAALRRWHALVRTAASVGHPGLHGEVLSQRAERQRRQEG